MGLLRVLKSVLRTLLHQKGGEIVNLLHEYYIWLLKHVHFNDNRYDLLMQQLFDSPFEVILDRDVNRIDDCLSLRGQFFYEIGVNGDFSNKKPCILELLISLAIRIDNEYLGNPDDPHPEFMFWEMICNLKLDKFDNSHYNCDEIYKILGIFVGRQYDFCGRGGIFPVKSRVSDQRELEIVSQMKAYLSENYC